MGRRSIVVGVFSMCLATRGMGLAISSTDDASAIVSRLQGSATVQEAGSPERRLEPFDWVAEGATIAVAKRSMVVLVLATGARFELTENARVMVLRAGLPISASVRALPSVPPVPGVAPIARSTEAGPGTNAIHPAVSGAVRIRGSSFTSLYPSGNSTIADHTTLRVDGPKGAPAFLVVIEDEKRTRVFDVKTTRPSVLIPPGVLEAGRPYYWRVAVADDSGAEEAEAAFVTLPTSIVQARGAFAASLRRDDARDLAVLARIDERLGLLMEARDELSEAEKRAPGNRQVRQMLAGIRKQLGEPTLHADRP
jgi:hypothetical protein